MTLTASVTGGKKLLGNINRYNIRLSHTCDELSTNLPACHQPESEAHLSLKSEPFSHRSRLKGITERRTSSVLNLSLLGAGGEAWRRKKQGQALLLQGKLERGLGRWVPTCRDRAGAGREEALHTERPS